jgi:multiple sugar transport system permease protein
MTQATIAAPARRHRPRGRVLPYLLSLPALLICIGILIPFATAVWYSMQRYNLAFPMTRGMIWWGNYLDFLTDPSFWNTLKVSIACGGADGGGTFGAASLAGARLSSTIHHERRARCC